jgi:site-specific DNA recombinase
MLVGGYTRVSTDEQVEGFSLDSQKERIDAFCKSQDWQIYDYYTDEGYSAKDLSRPGMEALLNAAKAKKFEAVVFYRLDRFSRRAVDVLRLVDEIFDPNGIILRSVTEPFDTATHAGRMMLTMLVAFSQYERESIAERTKINLRYKAGRGEWSGKRPFGYDIGENKRLIPNPDSRYVEMMFNEWNKGSSLLQIARFLNAEKAPTMLGGRWSNWHISCILRNPVYLGRVCYGRREGFGKNRKWTDQEKWITVFDAHAPLITEETFNLAQIRLLESDKIYKQNKCKNYLFSGLVRCAVCGEKYGSTNWPNSTGKVRIYYTRHHKKDDCPKGSIKADELEGKFLKLIELRAAKPESREQIIQRLNKDNGVSNINEEISRLKANLSKIEAKKARWMDAYGEGAISASDLKKRLGGVDSEREELITRIEALVISAERLMSNCAEVVEVYEVLPRILNDWSKFGNATKFRIIHQLVRSVKVHRIESESVPEIELI